ncbi:MAG TPA: hypothetical protein VKE69_03110, partial [Planctomycetota bacterium]|nr:hypothetical protein [Planctomycetota bacterium]
LKSFVPVLVLACVACSAAPTTFVLEQSQRRAGFDRFEMRHSPHADDPGLDPDLREAFEEGLASGLEDAGGFRRHEGTERTPKTLVLHYRAAGLTEGSLASRAGTAAVNALLPVAVVPEIGIGDLGMETTFLDAEGNVTGKVLVQSIVKGLFATDAATMRRIGVATAEYMSSKFAVRGAAPEGARDVSGTRVVSLVSEDARSELAAMQPFVGEWEMTYSVDFPGKESQSGRVRKVARLEADGCIYTELTETLEGAKSFSMTVVVWDPVARSLQLLGADSMYGAHTSQTISWEKDGDTLRAIVKEPAYTMELVEIFGDGGRTRRGSFRIWSADKKRLIATYRTEGTKRG